MRIAYVFFVVIISALGCCGSPFLGPNYAIYKGAWCGLADQPPTPVCNLGGSPVFADYLESRKVIPSKLCGTPPAIVLPSNYSTVSFTTDQLGFFKSFYPTFTLGSIFSRWQDWEYLRLSQ